MSRLNRIQNEIKQLEGGKFQKLCDQYLYRKMKWENIVSTGSMDGTDKTTIGNPDAYNYSDDQVKHYTFVMSGTRKESTTKLESDIKDAITKTHVKKGNIKEIICCHTSSNLTVKKDKELRKLAEPIKLTLVGIDTLAQDLLQFEYQDIVRDILGISETTEQVWSTNQFIAIHDKSKTNAPLNIEYIGNRDTMQKLIDDLNDSQILVLSGEPGTGKTKLAIEICKSLAVNSNVVCVKSNNMPVYQDIKDALDKNRVNYLFLDDANTITNFYAVANLLKIKDYEKNLKIILTVREYALSEIIETLHSFETRVEKVPLMDDFKLGLLIRRIHSEIDETTVNKIMKLSHNNPRIAVLVALMDNSSIDFFENSNGILDIYYNQILKENGISKNEKLTLFVLSFFTKVNLNNRESLSALLPFFGLNYTVFVEVINQLYDKELCDISQNEIVQVSDQSLSDFILIEFFSNRKSFKIRDFFINLYPKYAKEITEMLVRINEYNSSKEWTEYLFNEIKYVNFAVISEEYREDFLIRFGAFVPTESFAYVFRKIQEIETIEYHVTQENFQEEKVSDEITDPLIKILSLLSKNGQFNNAGKLLVEYLKKRQDKVIEIFSAIKSNFDVEYDKDDYLAKRMSILDTFSNQKDINQLTALLIVNVAEEFLRFSREESNCNVMMVCSQYHLPMDEKYLSYHHRKIFEILFKLYCIDDEEVNNAIDCLLINYPVYEIKNLFLETVISDLKCIGELFFENTDHLTVRRESVLSKLQTEINRYEIIIPPFSKYELTHKQKIFKIFSTNDNNSEIGEIDNSGSKKLRVKALGEIFTEYIGNLEGLFNILSEYQSDELLNNSELEKSIFRYYSSVETGDKTNILISLLNSNFLVSYPPNNYMSQLTFEEGRGVLNSIHKKIDVGWYISNLLTCECIEQEQIDEMSLILRNIKENEVFESFDILSFERYINQENYFLELLWKNFNETKINGNFFIPYFESEQMLERIIKIIGIKKIEKVYLYNLRTENIDYSGKLFKRLLKEGDINFAYLFLLELHSFELDYEIQKYYNHLKYLWEMKDIETAICLYLDFLIEENLQTYFELDYTLQLFLTANFEGSIEFITDEIFKTNDERRLVNLYNLILEIYDEEILFIFFQLLKEKKISDASFKKINLTRYIGEYPGSCVAIADKRIGFLNSLLLIFEDIEYLSYSCIVTEYIEYLKLYSQTELFSDYLG